MTRRLKVLGIVLALIGLGFIVGGGVAYAKVQAGYDSLKAFSGRAERRADLQRQRRARRW